MTVNHLSGISVLSNDGRPSLFKDEYCEQARKLCLLGATDEKIADFFGVTETTINNWKIKHPKFFESINAGKVMADAEIAESLFHRAKGFSHESTKILTVSDGQGEGSHIEEVPYTERFPPDPTSMIFWLKNRQPKLWREKQKAEEDEDDAAPINVTFKVINASKRAGTDDTTEQVPELTA